MIIKILEKLYKFDWKKYVVKGKYCEDKKGIHFKR